MDDLLTLDYSTIANVELTAIDLNPDTLVAAKENHHRLRTPVEVNFEQRDAWRLESNERWDLLTSNGLNIYVQDDKQCTDFYRNVATALRPGGYFIISFITPPDQWMPKDLQDLEFQRFLFSKVVPVKWSCFRSEEKTREQLGDAGFEVLTIRYDSQRMFPAIVARKR
jgi:2-polyprenyl-3-methyl-5-hydroxy-6-metoxy-1,4-benzoquinol methylase